MENLADELVKPDTSWVYDKANGAANEARERNEFEEDRERLINRIQKDLDEGPNAIGTTNDDGTINGSGSRIDGSAWSLKMLRTARAAQVDSGRGSLQGDSEAGEGAEQRGQRADSESDPGYGPEHLGTCAEGRPAGALPLRDRGQDLVDGPLLRVLHGSYAH